MYLEEKAHITKIIINWHHLVLMVSSLLRILENAVDADVKKPLSCLLDWVSWSVKWAGFAQSFKPPLWSWHNRRESSALRVPLLPQAPPRRLSHRSSFDQVAAPGMESSLSGLEKGKIFYFVFCTVLCILWYITE